MVKLYNAQIGNEIFPIKDYNLYELEQAINAGKVIAIADDGSLVAVEMKVYGGIEVGGEKVETLQEAFNIGGEVKLFADVVITEQVNVAKEVVLNLNGHNVVAEFEHNSGAINVAHGGKLTIKGMGCVDAPKCICAISMTTKGDTNDAEVAELVVENGIIRGCNYAVSGNGNKGRDNTKVTVNGGELTMVATSGAGIYNPQKGDVIINGGLIEGITGIEMRSGYLEVNGGTIVGHGIPAKSTPNGNGVTSIGCGVAVAQHTTENGVETVINGGLLKGYSALYQSNPQQNNSDLVNMTVNTGVFYAINGGSMPVYSEDKTGFVKGGTFVPAVEEKYMA